NDMCFFYQAEDGIRDRNVTGVQTCALPIYEFVQLIYTTIGFFIIFFLVPLMWDGKTIGTKIMRFKLVQSGDNQTSRKPLLKRTFALFLPFMLSHILSILQNVEIDMN